MLTINLCLHLPGARNKYNVQLIVKSFQFLFLIYIPVCYLIYPTIPAYLSIPLGFIVVMLTGQFFAMAVSLLLHLLLRDGYSEFKRERIVAFWELIEKDQPDVIACQELYGSWFLGSNVNKSRMIKAAKRLGYCHVNSGKPRLPALLFDQGLCIFSKWPIIESGHLIYKSQSVFDKYFVNRAGE